MSAFAAPHGADALAGRSERLVRARTFHTLDALRGIAALTVVAYHTAFIYGITAPAEGQIAVDLFFVMSGFIIAYRYEDDLCRGMGLAAFVKVRLVRLYPLFILGAILGVIPALVAVIGGHGDALHKGLVASFPLALFMLPSHFTWPQIKELYPLNYVAWSLALEIVVNIVYAATVRFWTVRRLIGLLVTAFAALCACAAAYGNIRGGFAWPHALIGIARILYGFTAGVLIYRFRDRMLFAVRLPWWSLLVVALAIFLFDAPWGKALWEVVAVAVLVPGIVVAAIANEPPKAAQGACAIAGVYSYVVYSLHAPFVGFFLRGEERMHLDLGAHSLGKALVFTGLLAALCVTAHLCYDKPVRAFLSRRRRAPGRATADRHGTAAAVKN